MSKPKSSSIRSKRKVIRQRVLRNVYKKLFKAADLAQEMPNIQTVLTNLKDPTDRLEQIIQDRIKVYGDVTISHRAIGYAFRAVLQNRWHHVEVPEIPPDLVAEMLAAFKLVRLARPVYHQDSADDLHNYVRFSEDMRKPK